MPWLALKSYSTENVNYLFFISFDFKFLKSSGNLN